MSAMANNFVVEKPKAVCWTCRKRFSRLYEHAKTCSDCGGALTYVGRFFHAPKRTDLKAWKRIEREVRAGRIFNRNIDDWGPGCMGSR